jgi:hypothetical protein
LGSITGGKSGDVEEFRERVWGKEVESVNGRGRIKLRRPGRILRMDIRVEWRLWMERRGNE